MAIARLFLLSMLLLNVLLPTVTMAENASGIQLFTAYPERTVQPGSSTSIDVTLYQYDAMPSAAKLSLEGIPPDWNAQLLGEGQPISSAMAFPGKGTPLQIRLDIPVNVALKTHRFTLQAQADSMHRSLPLALSFSRNLPSRLSIESKLPALRGSHLAAFNFPLTLRNDGGSDIVSTLSVDASSDFDYAFTEDQGTQQLTSLPIKAGSSKNVNLTIRVPRAIEPARYPLKVSAVAQGATAETTLSLELIGQPKLRLSGREGLLSFRAIAGEVQTVPIILANEGSASAVDIQLLGSGPLGWQLDFEPRSVAQLDAGEQTEVQLRATPSSTSLVGDYMITAKASTKSEIADSELRVTVNTSTLWGVTGLAIISISLIILAGAIAKYGRR